MKSGKLDEELGRMSEIVDHVRQHSLILFNESFSATNEREGSEIARQIVTALLDKAVEVFFVTHMYELARGFYDRDDYAGTFLRAGRREDGTRTFTMAEGEPFETSYGRDLYERIFAAEQPAQARSA
jgi:DNA mismatch repair ATPase MutS